MSTGLFDDNQLRALRQLHVTENVVQVVDIVFQGQFAVDAHGISFGERLDHDGQQFDTLIKIAKKFKTGIKEIMDQNRISNPHRILAGQVLKYDSNSLDRASFAQAESGSE